MDLNFVDPYINYDSEDIPYSLYEIYGLNKIRELSRQLRTFINYKTATMQYRFRPRTITCFDSVHEKYYVTKRNLKQIAAKFIKLLYKIKGDKISYKSELIGLVEIKKFVEDKCSRDLLTELKDVIQKLFIIIHELSDQQIHQDPNFLKFTVNLSQEVCGVLKILNSWASGFYEELRVNYRQLHDELTLLIPEEKVEKTTSKERKLLREGLKEW